MGRIGVVSVVHELGMGSGERINKIISPEKLTACHNMEMSLKNKIDIFLKIALLRYN